MKHAPMFDHERLDVYQLELGFVAWCTSLLSDIKTSGPAFHREVCDQLDRASLSARFNTAEGNGKCQGKQRAKFFNDARGSAVGCVACLDALVARGLTTVERVIEGKAMLLWVVGMLTMLVERFQQGGYRLREDAEDADDPGAIDVLPLNEDEGRERGGSA